MFVLTVVIALSLLREVNALFQYYGRVHKLLTFIYF